MNVQLKATDVSQVILSAKPDAKIFDALQEAFVLAFSSNQVVVLKVGASRAYRISPREYIARIQQEAFTPVIEAAPE